MTQKSLQFVTRMYKTKGWWPYMICLKLSLTWNVTSSSSLSITHSMSISPINTYSSMSAWMKRVKRVPSLPRTLKLPPWVWIRWLPLSKSCYARICVYCSNGYKMDPRRQIGHPPFKMETTWLWRKTIRVGRNHFPNDKVVFINIPSTSTTCLTPSISKLLYFISMK